MDSLRTDFRLALRILLKKPVYSAVAIIALAIGIGANTAVFSMVDALVLRPLSFEDLDRLVMIWGTHPQNRDRNNVLAADFLDWKNNNTTFENVTAYRWWDVNLTGSGEPERVQGFRVTTSFFDTLQVKPLLGRAFDSAEAVPGHNVAILNHGFWNRRFAGDRNIVGQSLMLNGESFTVIGVMPEDVDWPIGAELWAPLAFTNEDESRSSLNSVIAMGRIKRDLTVSQAQAEMDLFSQRLAAQFPETNTGRGIKLVKLPGQFGDEITEAFLSILLAAVGFVLLIACANVANLQLARATDRQKELGIRIALGARRGRIIQQLLVETLMLSLAGATLGLLIGWWAVDLTKASFPADKVQYITGFSRMDVNGRVLLLTMIIAVLTGVISGLAPAVQASKPDVNRILKEGGRGSSSGAARGWLRSLLVVSEVALALILLVGTGLTVSGFARILQNQRQGIDARNVITMTINLPVSKYKDSRRRVDYWRQVLDRTAQIPSVESVGAVFSLPSSDNWDTEDFSVEGQPPTEPGQKVAADYQSISPGYFKALRIPLTMGREFNENDGETSLPVVIINERIARQYWPGQNPIGKRIKFDTIKSLDHWLTIVGVVGDVKQFFFDKTARFTMYVPLRQSPDFNMSLALRSSDRNPMNLVAEVRACLASIDPDQPIFQIKTMEQVIDDHVFGIRLSAALMAIFGSIALLLSAVGVFSVMSYSVTQRTHEMGVRMALGAKYSDLLKLIVGQAMKLALIGLSIGLLPALALTKLMSSMLEGVVTLEPVVFAGLTAVLASAALFAGYLPARRATKVDPMAALRHE
jgi:putative ABC transport system permease protein